LKKVFNIGFVNGVMLHTALFLLQFPVVYLVVNTLAISMGTKARAVALVNVFTITESFYMTVLSGALFADRRLMFGAAYILAAVIWGAIFGVWHHIKASTSVLFVEQNPGMAVRLLRLPARLRVALFILAMLALSLPAMQMVMGRFAG